MESTLTLLGKSALVVLVTALICAFLIASPMIFCHGARGHCAEEGLASLLYTALASPIILILVTLFFFPSRWKDLLATVAILVVGMSAVAGFVAMSDPRAPAKRPEKVDDRQAMAAVYAMCLEQTARVVSQTSIDASEAIEQTVFGRCRIWRQKLLDRVHNHAGTNNPDVVTDVEQGFRLKLPQIISKAHR